LLKLILFWA